MSDTGHDEPERAAGMLTLPPRGRSGASRLPRHLRVRNYAIDPRTGEFRDPITETKFRRWRLPETVVSVRTFAAVALLAGLGFLLGDVSVYSVEKAVPAALIALFAMGSAGVLLVASTRNAAWRTIDLMVLMTVCALCLDTVSSAWLTGQVSDFLVTQSSVVVMAVYVFAPNRFLFNMIPAVVFTLVLSGMVLAGMHEHRGEVFSIIGWLLAANTLGAFTSHRLEHARRRRFVSLMENRHTYRRLQAQQQRTQAALTDLANAHSSVVTIHERMERELDQAVYIQRSLLPEQMTLDALARSHRLRVNARFLPSSHLGGDYWTLQAVDRRFVTVFIADFSGHGIGAAFNTFRLHTLLSEWGVGNRHPVNYLAWLNDMLKGVLPTGQYATALFGILDLTDNVFRYATAGTTPPLVLMPGGNEVVRGSGKGLPLGIMSKASYELRELSVPPGAALLLYSDAAVEGLCETDRDRGISNLAEIVMEIRADAGESEEDMSGRIADALAARPDWVHDDDLTLIYLERLVVAPVALPADTATTAAPSQEAGKAVGRMLKGDAA